MKRLLKWIGYTVGGLAAIIVLALAVVYAFSSSRMSKTYPPTQAAADAEALTIPTDSASIERGHHLVIAVGKCTGCHGDNLAGKLISDDRAFARLWSEADFFKALRNGVRPDGRILSAVMPWPETKNLTDDELRAMWIYIRNVKPRPAGG